MNDVNAEILEYAAKRGWPSTSIRDLTPSQYRRAAVAVRPMKRRIIDGATAIESRLATSTGLRRVPEHVAEANAAICEQCPKGYFALLRGGKPACTKCNCASKWLDAKWHDPKQYCPYGLWDNRQVKR